MKWGTGQVGRDEQRGRQGTSGRGTEKEKCESTWQCGVRDVVWGLLLVCSEPGIHLGSRSGPGDKEKKVTVPLWPSSTLLVCPFHKARTATREDKPCRLRFPEMPPGSEMGSNGSPVTPQMGSRVRSGTGASWHSALASLVPTVGKTLALGLGEQWSCAQHQPRGRHRWPLRCAARDVGWWAGTHPHSSTKHFLSAGP